MINNLLSFLTYENIYLIANWGVLPFWLLLIILPNHGLTNFLTQSVIVPLLLGAAYTLVAYNIFTFNFFSLYSPQILSTFSREK